MSTQRVCDKCGNDGPVHSNPSDKPRETLPDGWLMLTGAKGRNERAYDLCEGCARLFEMWLKEGKK